MPSPISKTLDKFQKLKGQGLRNKLSGIVIRTDPRTTAKGNKTCVQCLTAKRTGAPLPPEHANCRCYIQKR